MADDIASTADDVFRDYVTDGVPSSGANDPAKAGIRALFGMIAAVLSDIAGFSGQSLLFDTKAHMDADLAHAAGTGAIVYNDGTATNDALYVKSGISGSGSWVATPIVLSSALSAAVTAATAAIAALDAQVNMTPDVGDDTPVLVDAAGATLWAADFAGRFLGELSPDHQHTLISAVAVLLALGTADPGDDVPILETADGQPIIALGFDGTVLLPGGSTGGGGGGGSGGVSVSPPDALGDIDAWNVLVDGDLTYYEAMRWGDFPRGYVTDGTHHVAQSPSAVFGLLNAGSTLRSAGGDAPDAIYHVTSGTAFGAADGCNAAFGESLIGDRLASLRALPSVDCLDGGIDSPTLADLAVTATHNAFLALVTAQRTAWLGFGKTYQVDAIIVNQGLAEMDAVVADYETAFNAYLAALPTDVASASAQGNAPQILYHQTSGTADSGEDNAALGQISASTFGPTLVTPLYPFAIDPLSSATPTDDSVRLIGELERLAYDAVAAAAAWQCPLPVVATLAGAVITCSMDALSDLVLDTARTIANQGFHVDGITNGKTISSVAVSGQDVTITLSGAPTGALTLRYAWGETTPVSDGFVANRGNLRDSYAHASALVGGATLHRFAVGFQIPVS